MKSKMIFILRVCIGGLFIISGFSKMFKMSEFINIITQFNILPNPFILPFASLLPPIELVLGITLFIGYLTKFSSFIIMGMLLMMLVAIFPQLLNEHIISDCGCFGGIMDSTVDINLVIRDIMLFILTYIVFIQKKHILSLDNKLQLQ